MAGRQESLHTLRGTQLSLLTLTPPASAGLLSQNRGAVFTRPWVVELLLDLAGYTADKDLGAQLAVEPAAGEGAFLTSLVSRLISSAHAHGRDIAQCLDAIRAFEVDPASAGHTKALVRNLLAENGVAPNTTSKLVDSWIHCEDYLTTAEPLTADFVVGNPPYVRSEDIPEETAAFYRRCYPAMRGRADLYIAFFEAALRQLRDGGTCAFICADRWMRNQYGSALRDLITSRFAVDLVLEMHQADAFLDDVDAYPAITVIRRAAQGPAVVAAAGPGIAQDGHAGLVRSLTEGRVAAGICGLRVASVATWFQGDSPWPCQWPGQLALLRRLEEQFPALESNARVGIGVATGNDAVYVTRDANLVESGRLLPLAMAKDIHDGELQWSGHYLVDPWDRDGLVDLSAFPLLNAYFTAHKRVLQQRHTAVKNKSGWYKTIDRVTHTLVQKPKLLIADIKSTLNPVLDRGQTYPHHNLYFIASDKWDLEVLGGLLLSALGQFFVESYCVRMRGGYLRFQAQYLRRIRVPEPGQVEQSDAAELIAAFRQRDRDRATAAALRVYGVTAAELEEACGPR